MVGVSFKFGLFFLVSLLLQGFVPETAAGPVLVVNLDLEDAATTVGGEAFLAKEIPLRGQLSQHTGLFEVFFKTGPAGLVIFHNTIVAAVDSVEATIVRVRQVDVLAGQDVGDLLYGGAERQLAYSVRAQRCSQLQQQVPQQYVQCFQKCLLLNN